MPRARTPEEVRRLKARGIFDVGTFYLRKAGAGPLPKHKYWDREEEEEQE